MFLRRKSCAIALLLAGPFACAGKSTSPDQTSPRWETCETPDDCDDVPSAVACASGTCVDEYGRRLEVTKGKPTCEDYADCDDVETCVDGRCQSIAGTCANGVRDPGEQCDGADLAGQTCMTLSMGSNDGVLACGVDCTFVITGCNQPPPN